MEASGSRESVTLNAYVHIFLLGWDEGCSTKFEGVNPIDIWHDIVPCLLEGELWVIGCERLNNFAKFMCGSLGKGRESK